MATYVAFAFPLPDFSMNTAKTKKLLNGALVCLLAASAQNGVLTSPGFAAPAKEGGQSTPVEEKASQIVKNVGAFYKNMKGFTQTMSTEMRVSASTKQMSMASVFKVAFARPNKLFLNLESGRMGGQMVSDGNTVYLYTPVLNKYMKVPAPEDLSKIFETIDYQIVGGGFSNMSLVESMCNPDPYKQIMADVIKVENIGAEKIDDKDCDHIRFTQKEFTWDMWVRQGKEPWIVKVTADMSKLLANKPVPDAPPDAKAELICIYSNSQANVVPTAEMLTFKKPEGSQEVENFIDEKTSAADPVHPLLNRPAPAFDLDTVDGAKFDLASQKGKVVVLDFWATWCAPCVMSLPIHTEVANSLKDVVFLAVNLQETPEEIKQFLEKKKLKMPVGLDTEAKVAEMYMVRGLPQTVIIGKDGNVAGVDIGFAPNLRETFTKELNDILTK